MNDVDILQFALTLEHLQARMYVEIAEAKILTGKERKYLRDFGDHEKAHVQALIAALESLGESPVQAQERYSFPAFDSREAILTFAKTVEDVVVGAYQGAAAAITDKELLAAAGSIIQVEARHVALINLFLGLDPVPLPTTPGLTLDEVTAQLESVLQP